MKNAKITVYSTPACPYCVMAKDYLKSKNIDFIEIDVSKDEKQAEIMVEKSGQMGVPVIIINNQNKEDIVLGFDKDKINKILNI